RPATSPFAKVMAYAPRASSCSTVTMAPVLSVSCWSVMVCSSVVGLPDVRSVVRLDDRRWVLPGAHADVRQGGGREPSHAVVVLARAAVAHVALDATEAVALRLPLLAEAGDLVRVTADEVPPHDDLLAERLAADEDEASGRGTAVVDAQALAADSGVAQCRSGHGHALEGDVAGIDEQAVLEGGVDRQVQEGAGVQPQLRPHEG